jgi:hypothetical protein
MPPDLQAEPKETASKAFASALSGVVLSLVTVGTNWVQTGRVEPAVLHLLGSSLDVFLETAVAALVSFLLVYYAPRNRPADLGRLE